MTFEMGAQAVQGGLESAKLVFHILVMVTCNCRTEAADMPSMFCLVHVCECARNPCNSMRSLPVCYVLAVIIYLSCT